ncbi:hypothetical protein OIU78_008168 [Salix suchowensis]|nr:hypothetical protein OIU78_008168 [Salix suchowensis]
MLKPCNGSSTRALDDTPTDCTRQQNFLTDLLSRVLYFERERDGLFWLFEICNFRKRREKTVPFFTSSFLAWTYLSMDFSFIIFCCLQETSISYSRPQRLRSPQ